ncbi:hypothetical protein [Aerococcus viridans]|uniref:hypothetical protein n=1 Tax=Aerococcus viridans TaxID=1377 RepID=UPI003AA844AC
MQSVPVSEEIVAVLGVSPKEAWTGRDLVCALDNGHDIYQIKPDLEKAKDLPGLLVHVTAPGKEMTMTL